MIGILSFSFSGVLQQDVAGFVEMLVIAYQTIETHEITHATVNPPQMQNGQNP